MADFDWQSASGGGQDDAAGEAVDESIEVPWYPGSGAGDESTDEEDEEKEDEGEEAGGRGGEEEEASQCTLM